MLCAVCSYPRLLDLTHQEDRVVSPVGGRWRLTGEEVDTLASQMFCCGRRNGGADGAIEGLEVQLNPTLYTTLDNRTDLHWDVNLQQLQLRPVREQDASGSGENGAAAKVNRTIDTETEFVCEAEVVVAGVLATGSEPVVRTGSVRVFRTVVSSEMDGDAHVV